MDGNGYTVVYFPWEDLSGKPRVAGRFKTEKEKDDFLAGMWDNGFTEEEIQMTSVINDYNYMLPV